VQAAHIMMVLGSSCLGNHSVLIWCRIGREMGSLVCLTTDDWAWARDMPFEMTLSLGMAA